MKLSTIRIETTAHVDDATGRIVARFTPIFTPALLATGELRLATFDAWADDLAECVAKRQMAGESAKRSLSILANETIVLP